MQSAKFVVIFEVGSYVESSECADYILNIWTC